MKTLAAHDFRLAALQATALTPEHELSVNRLVRELLPSWLERFDADPAIIPLGEGLPRETARVALAARGGGLRCEIAPARIDLYWSAVEPPTGASQALDEPVRFLAEYAEHTGTRVGRLSVVATRIAPHEAPGRLLAARFCRAELLEQPFDRPEGFELHSHKRFVLGGRFMVNSWVRCRTGIAPAPGGARPVVQVEQDLNTLAEEATSRAFAPADLRAFFTAAAAELDGCLGVFFPGE